MFKIYLSRAVSPGVGISLPATIEEMREAYSLLNGTDTVPLETATAYVESSIPNLRQYLYAVSYTHLDVYKRQLSHSSITVEFPLC